MDLQEFTAYCKSKGFVFPSSEIYGGLSGFFDYGHLGTLLKKNIIDSYWRNFVLKHENIIGQDASIISNPTVWHASGHVEQFADPIIITKNHRYRADHFVEEKLNIPTDGLSVEQLMTLIEENDLKYEGEKVISVERKNLMLTTYVGTSTEPAYLRPETCQAIFCNAKYLANMERLSLPFGICQVGKAFRNEIAPRNFIFRCREFEQMEMEYFFDPFSKCKKEFEDIELQVLFSESKTTETYKLRTLSEKVNSHHLFWIYSFYTWLTNVIGLKKEKLRLREHHKTELSHYSSATFDIDYFYPFATDNSEGSFRELCGIANRSNYDITQHAKFSKKNLYMKDKDGENIYPHVIEPSIGLDRLFLAILCDAYEYDKEREYVVLHIDKKLSPIQYAVFPLFNKSYPKEDFINMGRKVFDSLIDNGYSAVYDQSGSIGKRYARQDEIGTPFCLTIDEISLQDGTVTLRHRDSKSQERVKYGDL